MTLRPESFNREEHNHLMGVTPDPPTCTLAHVDGCPDCVLNVEAPEHAETTARGCLAFYRCHDCGHTWETAWGCS
jgi:hypothetical protein